MRVAVIIPYFQRRSGILRKALRSILDQQGAPGLHVIVVDDSSPVSALEETSDTAHSPDFELRIIRQENRGPAAARNRGLDEVPRDIDYVAFLDSDDEWSPAHLRNAARALGHGFD